MKSARLSTAVLLVFLAGCSNGLNPGDRYCVAGHKAHYVGTGAELWDAEFLTDNDKTMRVHPEVARDIEECGE